MRISIAKSIPTFLGAALVYSVASRTRDISHFVLVLRERGEIKATPVKYICTCEGFQYNKKCWHVDEVRSRLVNEGS